VSRGSLEVVKLALAIVAFGLIVLEGTLRRRARAGGGAAKTPAPPASLPARHDRALGWAWALLAVLAVGAHFRFSSRAVFERYDTYDIVHYYLNAKYFPELGYTRLYQACFVADLERRRRLDDLGSMRDLYDQRVKGWHYVNELRRHPEAVKSHFSPRRWRQFKRDHRELDRRLRTFTWGRILIDRGYNATPTWHAVGHALASAVPARYIKALCQIDTALVVGMFLVIGWCYGRRVALVAVVWFCLSFSSSWPGVGWAMLRYDWLATSVAGVCLLSRGHRFASGALLGWAALSRIFPAVLLLFLVVRGAHRLVAERRLDRDALRIAAGFLLVTSLGTAATWATLGTEHFRDFRHDLEIQLAPENLSVNRMGLAVALAYRGETSKRELPTPRRQARYLETGRMGPIRTALGLGLLALVALSVFLPAGGKLPARREDDLAQLGFFGFALLLTASFYYWTLRLVPLILHARHRAHSSWDERGLAALFGIEILAASLNLALQFRYALTATTSILVSLYAASVCIVRGRAALRRRRLTTSPASG